LSTRGDLGHGQAGKEAELDQLGLRRVFCRQLGEGFGWFLRQETHCLQVDTQESATVIDTSLAASLFDQDPAHRLRGRREEVGAAVPLLLDFLVDEPEVAHLSTGARD
jgi:hypothetical protein